MNGHADRRRWWAAGVTLALLALPPAAAQDPPDPLAALSAELRHCRSDRQCVIVDSLPCSCSSGGQQIAVNRDYEAFWRGVFELWGGQRARVICPQTYNCRAERAVCVAGRCEAR